MDKKEAISEYIVCWSIDLENSENVDEIKIECQNLDRFFVLTL